MKKVFFFAVITTAFALTSFSDKGIAPNHKHAFYSSAYPFNEHYTENFDGVQFYKECTDELMTLSGSVNLYFEGIYNDNKSKGRIHINVRGIKAIGESGREYHISGTNNISSSYSYSNGVFILKGVQNERWTTAGGRNNFTISSSYYVFLDANGNFTVKRDEFETYCQ